MNRIHSLYRRSGEWIGAFSLRTRMFVRHTFAFAKKWLLWPVAVVVILACAWGLIEYWDNLFIIWGWLQTAEDSMESGSTTVRNIGLVIAGLIALPLAIWRSMVAQKQADVAQQSLLNERYQRGAEMLGSDVLSVRLGGIYALRSLAEDHPEQYHIQAMRLLCAFVRNPTKDTVVQTGMSNPEEGPLREDVQVALDAICACHEINTRRDRLDQFWLDLRDADLRGAQLESVDLSVKLSLHVKTFAEFINSYQSGADFERAKLHSAQMFSAKLPRANFSEAVLSHASLSYADLSRAQLWETDLSGARLQGANLSGAVLRRANLSRAYLFDTNLSGADLYNAEFPEFSVRGLTQSQLDQAVAELDNPPKLEGVLDAETGNQLVWCGGLPSDEHP